MVAQVVVGVGNEDPERDATPQLTEVGGRSRRMLLDGRADIEITRDGAVARLEHGQRADVANSEIVADAVEPVDDEHVVPRDGEQRAGGDGDSRVMGEVERGFLPRHDIPCVGVRAGELRDRNLAVWRDDVRLILRAAKRAPAYITLPKIRAVADAAEMVAFIEATRVEMGIDKPIPAHLLVETHGALARVFDLAALRGVEALSFGLMDFVSAHDGAIPDSAMRSPGQFDHPLVRRAKLEIAAACHAFGKVPSHNVSTEVRDMSVVANDAARARNEFGYTRMWSIHPAQVSAIVTAFAPREDEVTLAAEILLAAQAAQWGPTRHGDTLHDRASYRYYWSVLRRARATGRGVPAEAAPLFGPGTADAAGR